MNRKEMMAIHYFAGLFPMFSYGICWFFYYSDGCRDGRIVKTISETVQDNPQRVLFCASMTLESIVLYVLMVNRNKSLIRVRRRSNDLLCYIVKGLKYQVVVGLNLLSYVTLNDNAIVHFIGSGLFFLGSLMYFFASESIAKDAGYNPSEQSVFLNRVILIPFMAYIFFTISSAQSSKTIAAVWQYVFTILAWIKVIFLYHDFPFPAS